MFAVVLAELARVPLAVYGARPKLVLDVFGLALAEAPSYLWGGLLFLLGAALLSRLRLSVPVRTVAMLLLSGLVTGSLLAVLFRCRPVRRYIPAYVLLGGLFVLTILALRRVPAEHRAGLRAWILDRSVLYIAFPAAIAAHIYAYTASRGLAPSLHLFCLQGAHHLLGLGLFRLLLQTRVSPLGGRASVVGLGTAILLVVGGRVAAETGALKGGQPYLRAYSIIGQSRAIVHLFRSEDEGEPEAIPPLGESEALAIFSEHSAMPDLPEGFELGDYNVLLIASEATRFDETSFAEPEAATTPSLERMADGAFLFTRAYSPSSGTMQSMSGFLGMAYPSMLALETWKKSWHGRLRDEAPILPEHFGAAGYETFWVGHNYKDCFDVSINGFRRGWAHNKLHSSKFATVANDTKIGKTALKTLKKVAAGDRPFFGWIFLESPHSDYKAHYKDMPKETARERYRQEIRFADEEIGRILDALERSELLERTVIVYFSDHGEEFREHGGLRHKSTVYGESTHVPLIIRIPGVEGRTIDEPTSTLYAAPWLLLHSASSLREAALDSITRVFAPMMANTDGGVVSELCGHDRMMTSLVYPEHTFHYNFITQRYQVFDLREDPREQDDLFGRDPQLTERAIEQIDRYLEIRRDRRRYILRPDTKTPAKPKKTAAVPAKKRSGRAQP